MTKSYARSGIGRASLCQRTSRCEQSISPRSRQSIVSSYPDGLVAKLDRWTLDVWRYLADPSMTRFGRQELRNYMKEAEAALRVGLQQLATKDKVRQEAYAKHSLGKFPDFRVLNVVAPVDGPD
jgi:hypothetical protein